jgi:hypothetical protein
MRGRDASNLPADQRDILRLWRGGHTAAEIAAILDDGRSRGAICGLISRLRKNGVWVGRQDAPRAGADRLPADAPPVVEKPLAPPHRCRAPGCAGTKQPGREHCAECLRSHTRRAA